MLVRTSLASQGCNRGDDDDDNVFVVAFVGSGDKMRDDESHFRNFGIKQTGKFFVELSLLGNAR